ncbi:MAG: hypothetical protein LBB05_04125 [Puniceicoccales bacterium]|jgi:hypothetical protein|nr:hypothetical protein [Puniceicoccales bacterium]
MGDMTIKSNNAFKAIEDLAVNLGVIEKNGNAISIEKLMRSIKNANPEAVNDGIKISMENGPVTRQVSLGTMSNARLDITIQKACGNNKQIQCLLKEENPVIRNRVYVAFMKCDPELLKAALGNDQNKQKELAQYLQNAAAGTTPTPTPQLPASTPRVPVANAVPPSSAPVPDPTDSVSAPPPSVPAFVPAPVSGTAYKPAPDYLLRIFNPEDFKQNWATYEMSGLRKCAMEALKYVYEVSQLPGGANDPNVQILYAGARKVIEDHEIMFQYSQKRAHEKGKSLEMSHYPHLQEARKILDEIETNNTIPDPWPPLSLTNSKWTEGGEINEKFNEEFMDNLQPLQKQFAEILFASQDEKEILVANFAELLHKRYNPDSSMNLSKNMLDAIRKTLKECSNDNLNDQELTTLMKAFNPVLE